MSAYVHQLLLCILQRILEYRLENQRFVSSDECTDVC
jgi:hypothetical protein